jgi:hypothetical protein
MRSNQSTISQRPNAMATRKKFNNFFICKFHQSKSAKIPGYYPDIRACLISAQMNTIRNK